MKSFLTYINQSSRFRAIGSWLGTRFFTSTPALIVTYFIFVGIFFYGSWKTVDVAWFDESGYFYRGSALLRGDFSTARLTDIRSSPLMPVVYAGAITLLDSYDVTWAVLTFSVSLLGLACFLLLSRILNPSVSWLLAVFLVVIIPERDSNLPNYFLGPAFLWLGLALMGSRSWQRGLGLSVGALGALIRLELLLPLSLMVAVFFVLELRRFYKRPQILLELCLSYTVPALLFGGILWQARQPPPNNFNRSMVAFVSSYNVYHQQSIGSKEGVPVSDQGAYFEKVFGSADTIGEAFLSNPSNFLKYLFFNGKQTWHAIVDRNWRVLEWTSENYNRPPYDFDQFAHLVLGCFVLAGGWSYYQLISKHRAPNILKSPITLIAILSLISLIPIVLLYTPELRYFIVIPLLMLPTGYLVTCIIRVLYISPKTAPFIVLSLILLAPQPYNHGKVERDTAEELKFIRQQVPSGSALISLTSWTYNNYLTYKKHYLLPIDIGNYSRPRLVGAVDYAEVNNNQSVHLFLPVRFFSDEARQELLNDWYSVYPDRKWVLLTSEQGLYLYLLEESK